MSLLCSWVDIQSAGIEGGCNRLSALNKAFDTRPLEPSDPQFDLLSALRKMISSSPVTWTSRHVPGHQDNDPSVKLDWWATQNIQMDNFAKVFWMQHLYLAPVSTLFPTRVLKSGLATINSLLTTCPPSLTTFMQDMYGVEALKNPT